MSGILCWSPVAGGELPGGSGAVVSKDVTEARYLDSFGLVWDSVGVYAYSDGKLELFLNTYVDIAPELGGGFELQNQAVTYRSSWYYPNEAGIGASYWVRATRVNGEWREDVYPYDTWLSLSVLKAFESNKALYNSDEAPPRPPFIDASIKLEFSTSGTGTPIVATWNITMTVDGFYNGGGGS